MMDFFAKHFIPTEEGPAHPYWYMWVGASVLMLWLFVWWAIGMAPGTAFGNGFARQEAVTQIHITLLENELMDTRIRHCSANKPAARQFFYEQLQKKQRVYYDLTGQRYELPQCEDLGSVQP